MTCCTIPKVLDFLEVPSISLALFLENPCQGIPSSASVCFKKVQKDE